MTQRGKTLLKGHTLWREGNPIYPPPYAKYIGRAQCSCGATSLELTSNADRKRWHKQHKEIIRAAGVKV